MCPKCGEENIDGSSFCIKCGNSLKNMEENTMINSSINPDQTNQINDSTSINIQQINNNENEIIESQDVLTNNGEEQVNTASSLNNSDILSIKEKKPFKVKILIIALISILILGIVLFFVFKKDGTSSANLTNVKIKSLEYRYDPDKLIYIKKNNMYGFISTSGKEVIEAKYYSVYDSYGDYISVRVDDDRSTYSKSYAIIDKKGNIVVKSENQPKYFSEYEIWYVNNQIYDKNMKLISKNMLSVKDLSDGYFEYKIGESSYNVTEYGIMNYTGKKIYSSKSKIESVYIKNEYNKDDVYAAVIVYKDTYVERKEIVYLKTGKVVYTLDDVNNYDIHSEYNGVFYTSDKNGSKHEMYFYNGKLVYESDEYVGTISVYDYKNQILKFDYSAYYENNGKTKRYEYYDVKNGKYITELPINKTQNRTENNDYGFEVYSVSGEYGILKDYRVLLEHKYDSINKLDYSLFNYLKLKTKSELIYLQEEKSCIVYDINSKKERLRVDNCYYINSPGTSTFVSFNINNDNKIEKRVLYNLLTDKKMEIDSNLELDIYSNYVTIYDNNMRYYYNTKLEKIPIFDSCNCTKTCRNGK